MLSQQEYNKLKWQLNNIPSPITGQQRQNLRTALRKKLHEHELASTYPPFQPLEYQQFFINFQTTDLTLLHLIEACAVSTTFTLDTESVLNYRRPNKPTLIQIQIILRNSFSYLLIVEVCHLPRQHEPTFQLIRKFFQELFRPEKTIYVWGEITELNAFIPIGLFTLHQISLSNNKNFQKSFKHYWNNHYQHIPISTNSIDGSSCKCEQCLGINPTDTWSLQNAIAYELNQWLDKRHTCSNFDIGLDPQLYHFNLNELEHRRTLTHYAAYDCLSMHQLLLKLNLINNPQQIPMTTNTLTKENIIEQPSMIADFEETSSDDEIEFPLEREQHRRVVLVRTDSTTSSHILRTQNIPESTDNNDYYFDDIESISPDDKPELLQQQSSQSISLPVSNITEQTNDNHNDVEPILSDEDTPGPLTQATRKIVLTHTKQTHENQQPQQLTDKQRKEIHNRRCTLRQRTRLYKHEIIRRGIDRRFTITQVKEILRQHSIQFSIINVSTSSLTNRTSLYIGIKNSQLLREYERKTRNLFTTDHYNEIHSHKRQFNSTDNHYRRKQRN